MVRELPARWYPAPLLVEDPPLKLGPISPSWENIFRAAYSCKSSLHAEWKFWSLLQWTKWEEVQNAAWENFREREDWLSVWRKLEKYFQSHRWKYFPLVQKKELPPYKCGIDIRRLEEADNGTWSCVMRVGKEGKVVTYDLPVQGDDTSGRDGGKGKREEWYLEQGWIYCLGFLKCAKKSPKIWQNVLKSPRDPKIVGQFLTHYMHYIHPWECATALSSAKRNKTQIKMVRFLHFHSISWLTWDLDW